MIELFEHQTRKDIIIKVGNDALNVATGSIYRNAILGDKYIPVEQCIIYSNDNCKLYKTVIYIYFVNNNDKIYRINFDKGILIEEMYNSIERYIPVFGCEYKDKITLRKKVR